MGTLSALLNLSQNSLLANQAAINITANNVANANTPGYTTQVAVWTQADTVSLGNGVSASEGANVSVKSLRDLVLNYRIQQQTQQESSSSAESTALDDLQSIFGLTTSSTVAASTTIGTDMNTFFSSLSTLQSSPSSTSDRQAVLSAAETLATDFNNVSSAIAGQTTSLNEQALGAVDQINSLTSSIAALNLQIGSTSPNADSGTLEDQRQQDLTQLSQYIGFSMTKTENNGITLATANGQVLVSEGQSFALKTTMSGSNVNILTAGGQDITSVLDGTSSGITGGLLGGVLKARDVELPKIATSLDTLAYAVGSAVNTANQNGLDGSGNAGAAIFTLPGTSVGAASVISVASTVTSNSIAAAAVGEGTSGGTNAKALAALSTTNLVGSLTASSFYSSMLTQLGDMTLNSTNANTTQKASLTQLTTQQSSLSSVNEDNEAANLTQYEKSYNAAAKVFAIVNQLMAGAINLGQEVTIS